MNVDENWDLDSCDESDYFDCASKFQVFLLVKTMNIICPTLHTKFLKHSFTMIVRSWNSESQVLSSIIL